MLLFKLTDVQVLYFFYFFFEFCLFLSAPSSSFSSSLSSSLFLTFSDQLSDSVKRTTVITPAGFPHKFYAAGQTTSEAQHSFTLPADAIMKTVKTRISMHVKYVTFPYVPSCFFYLFYIFNSISPPPSSPVPRRVSASLEDAFTGLIREPGGCFEQVSSTAHPMIMAQQYFLANPSPSLEPTIQRAKQHIESSYT